MRSPAIAIALSVPLLAGTQITDTVQTPFTGTLFQGRITIQGPAMTTASGMTIARWEQTINIAAGAISIELEPNDTALPSGTYYTVRYFPTSGASWQETWIVPTSATPLKVKDVRTAGGIPTLTWPASGDLTGNFPGPTVARLRGRAIADTAPANGQALIWSAANNRWQPGTVSGGGSGPTYTWLTAAVWWDAATDVTWDELQ